MLTTALECGDRSNPDPALDSNHFLLPLDISVVGNGLTKDLRPLLTGRSEAMRAAPSTEEV
jgi:hypothetical protein